MPCASFSMLDGPGGTGSDVPVRGCWVSRDVIVAAIYQAYLFSQMASMLLSIKLSSRSTQMSQTHSKSQRKMCITK